MDSVYVMRRIAELRIATLRAEGCPPCGFFARIKRI